MRLTADVLLRADHYLNPMREREINLRGLKAPTIENLAVTQVSILSFSKIICSTEMFIFSFSRKQDQFDVIDLSDNEIRKLDNFPKMSRLSSLFLSNNYISRISKNLGANLLGLKYLVLTNNRVSSLAELEGLFSLSKLEALSLLDNAVSQKPNYRMFVIYKIPSLKMLDFAKIARAEREAAEKFFKSVQGVAFLEATAAEEVASGIVLDFFIATQF